MVQAPHNPSEMTLRAAFDSLWLGGYVGGFTWMAEKFYAMTPEEQEHANV